MKKRKTFTVMAILIAVLILGVGYAAISNVTLTLNGTANVKADANFSVEYDTNHTVVKSTTDTINFGTTESPDNRAVVAGAYSNATTATMTVNLDTSHTSAYAVYKVDNKSTDLAAELTPSVTQVSGANADYFGTITAVYYTAEDCTTELTGNLAPQTSAYLKVTVPKGSKIPAEDVTGATFTVTTTAVPKETSN